MKKTLTKLKFHGGVAMMDFKTFINPATFDIDFLTATLIIDLTTAQVELARSKYNAKTTLM